EDGAGPLPMMPGLFPEERELPGPGRTLHSRVTGTAEADGGAGRRPPRWQQRLDLSLGGPVSAESGPMPSG
ncbi:MAG TPA: hypothetical protein VGO89_20795, partial [Streptomyces sp.]|nr:hypothetical protein [Streptomyces sp.]